MYRIIRKLGGGGMADVFLAVHEGAAGVERQVVIKRLTPAMAAQPEIVTMFLDEARIVARLHHHNIAQIFELGSDADGYFLAMEYLDGWDASRIVERAAERGELAMAAALAIAAGAAAGLEHAHEHGVIHRDVSAANLFVTVDGGVKVIDFGIARAADRLTTTRAGMIKGKVPYMSPEQVASRPLDRRSDVYSLGVVLYELVCGARPFDRPGDGDLAVMRRIDDGDHRLASRLRPGCPAALDAVLERMLARDPERRPQTAAEVVVELDAIARAEGWSSSAHELGAALRGLFAEPGPREDGGPELELPARQTAALAKSPPPATPQRRWPWLLAALAGLGIAAVTTIWIARAPRATGVDRITAADATVAGAPDCAEIAGVVLEAAAIDLGASGSVREARAVTAQLRLVVDLDDSCGAEVLGQLDALEGAIAVRESDRRLVFDGLDADGLPRYHDADTGARLDADEVDRR